MAGLGLHGTRRKEKLAGDLLVGESGRDERRHVAFSSAQLQPAHRAARVFDLDAKLTEAAAGHCRLETCAPLGGASQYCPQLVYGVAAPAGLDGLRGPVARELREAGL